MFSMFSMFTRSNTGASPVLPTSTADITFASVPSHPLVRERVRAVWHSLVIAFLWIFVGSVPRTPFGDVECGRPFPADAPFDYSSTPIVPIPSSRTLPIIVISAPASGDARSGDSVESTIDASDQQIRSDPKCPSHASPELVDDPNNAFLPSLALTINSAKDTTSVRLTPEQVPSTPRPTFIITPPNTPNYLPPHRQKDRIALRRPLRKRMDERYLTIPVIQARSRVRAPPGSKAATTRLKPKSRSSYLMQLKSKTTRGARGMNASSSTPISSSHTRQSTLDHNHSLATNAGPNGTSATLLPVPDTTDNISTLQSTSCSHTDQHLLNPSTNTSTTSLACAEAKQLVMAASALPSTDTSSTPTDLRDPLRYDSIINTDTSLSAGRYCTTVPGMHVSEFPSPVVADCHDPIRYDARLAEAKNKETSRIREYDDRQGK